MVKFSVYLNRRVFVMGWCQTVRYQFSNWSDDTVRETNKCSDHFVQILSVNRVVYTLLYKKHSFSYCVQTEANIFPGATIAQLTAIFVSKLAAAHLCRVGASPAGDIRTRFMCECLIVLSVAPASVAQLDAPSDWRPEWSRVRPRRGRQHSFVEIDHEIFSTVILSLPLIQEGQLSVSGERMCTILVNRLED